MLTYKEKFYVTLKIESLMLAAGITLVCLERPVTALAIAFGRYIERCFEKQTLNWHSIKEKRDVQDSPCNIILPFPYLLNIYTVKKKLGRPLTLLRLPMGLRRGEGVFVEVIVNWQV